MIEAVVRELAARESPPSIVDGNPNVEAEGANEIAQPTLHLSVRLIVDASHFDHGIRPGSGPWERRPVAQASVLQTLEKPAIEQDALVAPRDEVLRAVTVLAAPRNVSEVGADPLTTMSR